MPSPTLTPPITSPTLLSVLAAASTARQQCLELLDLLAHQNPSESSSMCEEEEIEISARKIESRIALLRGLNRRAILEVRRTKGETTEARQEIDGLLLGLQNLGYERGCLRGEILAAGGFDHKYMKLPMLSVEEFLELHPECEGLGEHELTLARIEDERVQRAELEVRRAELVKRKEELLRETAAKKEELGKLDSEVEKWMKGQEGVRGLLEAREKRVAEREKAAADAAAAAVDDAV